MIDLLWTLGKYVLFSLVGLLTYLVYTVIVQPYLFRRKYKKYPNVYVSDDYYPLTGNFIEMIRDVNAGKVYYQHIRDQGNTICKNDLKLEYKGSQAIFKVVSSKAHHEFSELVPQKIDRQAEFHSFGKLSTTSFAQISTTKNQQKRRKAYIKLLSLNSSSKYIPGFIDCLKSITREWKVGESYSCVKEMNSFTFTVFMHVLFGKDLQNFALHEVDYINDSNQVQKLPFREFIIKLMTALG